MSDGWKTIRVPPEAYETAKAQKDEHGRTWGQQLVRPDDDADDRVNVDAMAEAVASNIDATPAAVEVDADELAARIVDEIAATAGGPQVDDSKIAREVARQLDYTAIADKVSQDVVSSLQR